MSTPGPGEGGYRPDTPSGGGPGPYGGQGGGQPYGQPPHGSSSPFAYNPYGAPYPKPDAESEKVTRPGTMIAGLVLMMISTLPFLLIGVALLVVPADNPALQGVIAGLNTLDPNNELPPDQRLLAIRLAGGLIAGVGLLYILFAALAFAGRNWARIIATVMTGGFAVLWILNVFAVGTMDTANLVLVLGVMAAAIGGTVILYLREPSKYFASRYR